jgi:NTE family protein
MSIPGLFPCVELDGRVLVDGGATASVPVEAARGLGVDYVIGVNLMDRLNREFSCSSGLDINFRVDDIAKRRLNLMRAQEADIVIHPRLETVHWADFDRLDFCIQRGREATLLALDEIRPKVRARKRPRWRLFQYLLDRRMSR